MAASALLQRSKFLTLSFSGAGHLLPYHLGVACTIKSHEQSLATPINAVSGSSSGAIAAAAFVYFDNDRVAEYADRFISSGGRAMHHLEEMLKESTAAAGDGFERSAPSLHIAATRCSDGSPCLFDFPPTLSSVTDGDHLLKCIKASCRIPPHFHPADVMPSRFSGPATYPEEDGVPIDGCSYADGGIAAPAPPTPLDAMEGACRVVISPISGRSEDNAIRISPSDESWKLPFGLTCRGGFHANASVQNLRAMQVSAGLASTPILREWFERGIEDATRALTR